MTPLNQLGNLDLSAPEDSRAADLETLCGAVVRLVDHAHGHAQRRAIRRFLLEVAWLESQGVTDRPHEGRIGLFGLTPQMARVGIGVAQRQGWLDDLAGLSAGLTGAQLTQAADALKDVTEWPQDNDLFTAMLASDPFAALLARCFILSLPGAIPQDQAGRATYWAQQYNPDLVASENDREAAYLQGAQAADTAAPPSVPVSGASVVADPTQRALPYRTAAIGCIVVHTTGDTDWAAILRFYTDAQGFQPHYAIEQDGTIHQIVDEDVVAFHVGMSNTEIGHYQQGYNHWSHIRATQNQGTWSYTDTGAELANYGTWRDTWLSAPVQSPLDLATGANPNSVSVGIELEAPENAERTPDIFSDAQYDALIRLLASISTRNSLSIDRAHILGHYDANPFNRSNASGGWDPGEAFNWTRAIDGAAQAAAGNP